jgi:hypothetical protein
VISEEFVVILFWQVYSGEQKGKKRVERRDAKSEDTAC